jgi:hypothetical protein
MEVFFGVEFEKDICEILVLFVEKFLKAKYHNRLTTILSLSQAS